MKFVIFKKQRVVPKTLRFIDKFNFNINTNNLILVTNDRKVEEVIPMGAIRKIQITFGEED